MCLPAAALAVAAGVTSAAGSVMSGLQANAQGKYEGDIAKRNAQMEIDAAHESVTTGYGERRNYWREIGAIKGQQEASMAANGLDMSFGAPVRMAEDTQTLANEDADNLYRNIDDRTKGRQINASNFITEAKAARMRGKSALKSSIIQGATSLLGAASQAKAYKAKGG